MNSMVSAYNGIELHKPAGLTEAEWKSTRDDLRKTEAGYLIKDASPAAQSAPVASSGKSFAMPQNGSIEFAADAAKREKAEKVQANDKPAKQRGRPTKQAVESV